MITRRDFLKLSGASLAALYAATRARFLGGVYAQVGQAPPLPGNQIPQFVDPLPLLGAPTEQGGLIEVLVNDPATLNTIFMREFDAHILPTGLFAPGAKPATRVWGYRMGAAPTLADTYLGPVIVAQRSEATVKRPTKIKWVNALPDTGATTPTAWVTSTDQTLHWANPNNLPMFHGICTIPPAAGDNARCFNYSGPIPVVPHLHGGEVPPQLDGGPDAWFLGATAAGYTAHGHAYYSFHDPNNQGEDNFAEYYYPNTQEAADIWFHDHALGITRLNVYAGIAGGYILYDNINAPPSDLGGLAGAAKIIPLIIQDRKFDINGQLFFDNLGINPEHPFWVPEFVGDVICVNGKSWPYLNVDQKRYRFLFLDGSNARFYDMFLIDPISGVMGPPMYVIGTDGGYLDNPVKIDPNATGADLKAGISRSLVMGPGERYNVLIDFGDANWLAAINAAYAAMKPKGQTPANPLRLHLRNNARTPFPNGASAPNSTTGRVMEFRVAATPTGVLPDISYNPATTANLRPGHAIVSLTGATPQVKRQLTLNEVMGPGGPLEVLVNNTKWSGHSPRTYGDFYYDDTSDTYYSELPKEGDTEQWEIINLTADAHPIHLHLVQFQLMNRQAFDVAGYTAAYNAAFPALGGGAAGLFIPAFGPPLDYNAPNNDDAVGGNPAIGPFLNAKKWPAMPPLQQEKGWKDTVIMYPGEVTRIMVRWAPTDLATNAPAADLHFPFDPNGGHGFVWHCHIIDHEDNEMMRPDQVQPKNGVARAYVGKKDGGTDY